MLRACLVVIALSGCIGQRANRARYNTLAQTPSSDAVHARPATSETRPWKVGQWTLFRQTSPRGTWFTRMTVLAEDACGTWIEIVHDGVEKSERYVFCMREASDPDVPWPSSGERIQLGMMQLNGGEPATFDFRDGTDGYLGWFQVATDSFPTLMRTALPAGTSVDVAVPAGRFEGATYERVGGREIWAHPDVPFGGVVQIREGRAVTELVAFGTTAASESRMLAGLVATSTVPSIGRIFVAPGFGVGYATGEPSSEAAGLHFTYGFRVADRIDVVAELAENGADAPDPMSSLEHTQLQVGVRWLPFRAAPTARRKLFDPRTLYLQATLGYAKLEEESTTGDETAAEGLAASAVIGWMPCQGRDWSLGFEVADRVGLYFADEGIRHNIIVSSVIQLHLPDFRSRLVTPRRAPAPSSPPRSTPPVAASAATYPGSR